MDWSRVRRAEVWVDGETDEAILVEEAAPGEGLVVVDRWPADPDDPADAAHRLRHKRPEGRAWPDTPAHGG